MFANTRYFAAVALAMLACACGCQTTSLSHNAPPSGMRMLVDERAMKAEVLAKVPLGTSIENAQRLMEENGFECSRGTDETTGEEFLYCDKSVSSSLFAGHRWQIKFWLDAVSVRNVTVSCGAVGI